MPGGYLRGRSAWSGRWSGFEKLSDIVIEILLHNIYNYLSNSRLFDKLNRCLN